MPPERTIRVNFNVSSDESQMLLALAEQEGESISAYLRRAVRQAYVQAFGDEKPKKAAARVATRRSGS